MDRPVHRRVGRVVEAPRAPTGADGPERPGYAATVTTSAPTWARALSRPGVQGLLGAAVVTAAFVWALPRFADYDEVWGQIRGLDRGVLPALALVAAVNLVAPSLSQVAALPGLRLRHAVLVDWTTTTVTNLLPGGSALAIGLTWSMYRSLDLTGSAIARSVVVTGVWDTLVKLGTPIVAVLWLAGQRPVGPGLVQAAVVGALLAVVAVTLALIVLAGSAPTRVIGSTLDRLPLVGRGWPPRLESLRSDTLGLLGQRGVALTGWTLAGHANLYLLLVVCLRAVGVDRSILGWAAVLVAFAFGRLVTAIPISPGGVGVMEVGLVGALTAVAAETTVAGVGADTAAAIVAAVLVFRFLSFALPLPLGLIGWWWWSRHRARIEDPVTPGGPVPT